VVSAKSTWDGLGITWDENSGISAQQQDVSFKNWEIDLAELGPNYRNYRSFMRDLVMYCPAGYFYDESMPNCNLVEQSQTYKVPGTGGNIVSIGSGTYTPTAANHAQSVKNLFPNGELNLLSPGSGCPLQAGTGHGRPGRAPGENN
jgi:hypothetical protein